MINSNEKTGGNNAAAIQLLPADDRGSHQRRVLVIDDDRRFSNAIAESLEMTGVDVFIAFDGNSGLAVALTQEPDLIILDTRMPYRSGYLVMEYLATETDLQIPTIMLSENEGHRHRSYALMLGAIDFVEKPVDPVALVNRVSGLLFEPTRVA
jgi:DNA-binding response OmpR family regulator